LLRGQGLKADDDSSPSMGSMMRSAGMLFLLFIFFAGCGIPTSRTMIVPKGVAQSPEDLMAKLDLLKPGMEIAEVFELLGIQRKTPGVREIVIAEEKQRVLYGATQMIGTPEELERFRDYLGNHRIIEIRFRDIESSLVFDSIVSVVNTKTGPDFLSYVVFYEGKLINAPSKPDNFYRDESTRPT
jgi:hypothetical protein